MKNLPRKFVQPLIDKILKAELPGINTIEDLHNAMRGNEVNADGSSFTNGQTLTRRDSIKDIIGHVTFTEILDENIDRIVAQQNVPPAPNQPAAKAQEPQQPGESRTTTSRSELDFGPAGDMTIETTITEEIPHLPELQPETFEAVPGPETLGPAAPMAQAVAGPESLGPAAPMAQAVAGPELLGPTEPPASTLAEVDTAKIDVQAANPAMMELTAQVSAMQQTMLAMMKQIQQQQEIIAQQATQLAQATQQPAAPEEPIAVAQAPVRSAAVEPAVREPTNAERIELVDAKLAALNSQFNFAERGSPEEAQLLEQINEAKQEKWAIPGGAESSFTQLGEKLDEIKQNHIESEMQDLDLDVYRAEAEAAMAEANQRRDNTFQNGGFSESPGYGIPENSHSSGTTINIYTGPRETSSAADQYGCPPGHGIGEEGLSCKAEFQQVATLEGVQATMDLQAAMKAERELAAQNVDGVGVESPNNNLAGMDMKIG